MVEWPCCGFRSQKPSILTRVMDNSVTLGYLRQILCVSECVGLCPSIEQATEKRWAHFEAPLNLFTLSAAHSLTENQCQC